MDKINCTKEIKDSIDENINKYAPAFIALCLCSIHNELEGEDEMTCNGFSVRFCKGGSKRWMQSGSDHEISLESENTADFIYSFYDDLVNLQGDWNGDGSEEKELQSDLKKIFSNYTKYIKSKYPNLEIIYSIIDGI